jgi:hypothetical protein
MTIREHGSGQLIDRPSAVDARNSCRIYFDVQGIIRSKSGFFSVLAHMSVRHGSDREEDGGGPGGTPAARRWTLA